MSALSDLQKKLEKESQGIMFPFSAKIPTVDTTQQVYNSATDGIMNMQGKKYVGPDSVIQYTPEGQRQLKEIEKGMLPQFDQEQFPDVGQGKVENRGGTTPLPTPTPPVKTEPEAPAIDPCPVGFKFDPQLQRCVAIPQPKSDRQTGPSNPPRNIGPAANAVSQIAKTIKKQFGEGGLYKDGFKEKVTLQIDNSTFLSKLGPFGKLIDSFLIQGPANKNFVDTFGKQNYPDDITVIENKDGTITATFNQKGKQIADELMTKESLSGNLASTQKTKNGNIIIAPNGQPEIIGPIKVGSFGTTDFYQKDKDAKGKDIPFTKDQIKAQQQQQEQRREQAKRLKKQQEQQKDKSKDYSMPSGASNQYKKGTGGGAPGYTRSFTKRAAPVKKQIKSEKFSGKGFTRGR